MSVANVGAVGRPRRSVLTLGRFTCFDMNSAFQRRIRGRRLVTLIGVGVVAGYVVTVGIVPPMIRHTGDGGQLQWLPSVPGAVALLQAYEWPADQLSRVRVLHSLFNLSASFWWGLL